MDSPTRNITTIHNTVIYTFTPRLLMGSNAIEKNRNQKIDSFANYKPGMPYIKHKLSPMLTIVRPVKSSHPAVAPFLATRRGGGKIFIHFAPNSNRIAPRNPLLLPSSSLAQLLPSPTDTLSENPPHSIAFRSLRIPSQTLQRDPHPQHKQWTAHLYHRPRDHGLHRAPRHRYAPARARHYEKLTDMVIASAPRDTISLPLMPWNLSLQSSPTPWQT